MTKNNLKNKLLSTKLFIDNEYLDKYVELVTSCAVTKEAFKTQTHHILPKTYFRHFNLSVDDSSDNLVELLYKDHVLAHWLLQKCSTGFLRRNNGYAVRFLVNTKNFLRDTHTETELSELQRLYESSIFSIDEQEFKDFYRNHSRQETCKHFNINRNIVSQLAKKYNCSKWSARRIDSYNNGTPIIYKETLENYYLIENHTLIETAEFFKVNKITIIRKLKEFNLSQRKAKYRHEFKSEYKTTLNDEEVQEFIKYYKNHSMRNTSIKFNMSYCRVKYYVKKLGISKRREKDYDTSKNNCKITCKN